MKIKSISEQLGLRETDTTYEGVYCTGDLELFDYNVGLVEVTINKNYGVNSIIHIQTIDDGGWIAYTKDEVDVNKLAKDFSKKFKTKLPSEKVLNEFLSKYKIYGLKY